jgi:hypothetical protein
METFKKQALFWDVDRKKIDLEKHRQFIVERILDRGDLDDLKWSEKYYGKKAMKEIFLKSAKKFNAKTRNFWCLLFNLEKSQCTERQSTQKQSPFWRR